MELPRQDPDQLLRAIRNDASTKKSGKLKIFFGYAAGVGKTYAMLQAAHQAKERGIDVVAGYIEPHARPQTMALLDGLEQLPVKQVVLFMILPVFRPRIVKRLISSLSLRKFW